MEEHTNRLRRGRAAAAGIIAALTLGGCVYPKVEMCTTRGACTINAPSQVTVQPVSLPAPKVLP